MSMSDTPDPKENVWPRPYLTTVLRARDLARTAAPAVLTKQGGVARFPPGLILARFVLSIDQITPKVPAMGKPATVYFTLNNNSGKPSSGVVRGSLGGSVPINDLAASATISGSFSFVPQSAGKGIAVVVDYIETGGKKFVLFAEVAAEDEIDIDVVTGYTLEIAEWFRNPDADLRAPGAAAAVCQNRTAFDAGNLFANPPTMEWAPALDQTDELGSNVGLSGWVCSVNRKPPDDPQADVPFLHPFYNDWTLYLAADPQFSNLLSPGTTISQDQASQNSTVAGQPSALDFAMQNQIPLPTVNGEPSFIEFEMEQGLLTDEYWPVQGDRAAALGRWIVDCGHNNFSTEIHPPLVLAKAAVSGNETQVKIIGRAFLTSQWFNGKTLLSALLEQLGTKETEAAIAMALFPPALAAISAMEAKPKVLSPPFSGLQSVVFTVRPPSGRLDPEDKLLLSYHFTVRNGVYVSAFQGAYPDEVAVLILMNDAAYNPAPLPPEIPISIPIGQVGPGGGSGQTDIEAVLGVAIGINPAVAAVLAKGINTIRYKMPPPVSSVDADYTVTDQVVDENLRVPGQPYAVDDSQPYPIYGWLTLRWRRHLTAHEASPISALSNWTGFEATRAR
jgi:hypothetical protein